MLDTAAASERATGGPLCLYGESAGGHLALVAAARLRSIDCVIGVGTPTDLVNYRSEAVPDAEPRVKLVALRAARYFGTTPNELAPWDPVTLAPAIHADLLLLREGDDAVVSSAHARRVQAASPATQILELEPGDPADLSTALLHGTVSALGRAAYAAALGAFADRAVAARKAERAATRTGCCRVAARSRDRPGRCASGAALPRELAARVAPLRSARLAATRRHDQRRDQRRAHLGSPARDPQRPWGAGCDREAARTVSVRPGPRSQVTLRAR